MKPAAEDVEVLLPLLGVAGRGGPVDGDVADTLL
jgi:hypothetical protein